MLGKTTKALSMKLLPKCIIRRLKADYQYHRNKFQNFSHKIVTNKIFDYVMLVFIIFSVVLLALDNPLNDPNGKM